MKRKIDKQVQDYLDYCSKVRNFTDTTMKNKRVLLAHFVTWSGVRAAEEVTDGLLADYMKSLASRDLKGQSVNQYMIMVQMFLRFWRERGVKIRASSSLYLKARTTPPRRKYYSKEQIEDVLAIADLRQALVVSIMFSTGLRIGEVAKLRLGDFNGTEIEVVGKGRKRARVYVNEQVSELLDDYIESYEVTDYLFPAGRGRIDSPHVSYASIAKWIKQAFAAAGYKDCYPHAIRHSFATEICRNGAPIEVAREMLRHNSVTTTERYVHWFDGKNEQYFRQYGCGKLQQNDA